jgi:glucose dehydrogenase
VRIPKASRALATTAAIDHIAGFQYCGRPNTMPIRLTLILTAAMTLPVLLAQKTKDNGADWPMYNRDLAGTRFSPLTQVIRPTSQS